MCSRNPKETISRLNSLHRAFISEQIHVEPCPISVTEEEASGKGKEERKENDPFIAADKAAREVILEKYMLDTSFVMLPPDALMHIACARGELQDSGEGGEEYMTLISDLKVTLSEMCSEIEDSEVSEKEYVFWNSLLECSKYFTDTPVGQRKLKEKVMLWKESLSRWLSRVSEESKSKTDEMVGSNGIPDDDIDTAVMDYVVVSSFVERLETLLLDMMSLPVFSISS